MHVWNVLNVVRSKYRTQKLRKKIAICTPSHNLSGYIFATKAFIDNRKKLLNSNMPSTCSHNMANFDALTAEIRWRVLGTPANFRSFESCLRLQRRRSPEANQTLHDLWPSPGLLHCIHFGRLLPHGRILPHAKSTLRVKSSVLYIGSVTARHLSLIHISEPTRPY